LCDWITFAVEYKLKKDTLNAAKRRLPELQKRVKEQLLLIQEKHNALANADINIKEMKTVAKIKEGNNAKRIVNIDKNNKVDNNKNDALNFIKNSTPKINKSKII